MAEAPAVGALALGVLAGGEARRLAHADKAWIECDGVPQVLRWTGAFERRVAGTLVATRRSEARLAAHGLATVRDRVTGFGPVGGLHALAHATPAPWLLTLPVDLLLPHTLAADALLDGLLASSGAHGAHAHDELGPQPLVALWRVDALRAACDEAIAADRRAVRALVASHGLPAARFAGRFGNLNTFDDLARAGARLEPP